MEYMAINSPPKGRDIILAGPLVYATLKKEGLPGLIEQYPREASGKFLVTNTEKKVHIFLDEYVFSLANRKFALAIDGYLAWGKKNSKSKRNAVILLGGASSEEFTHINILVFLDQTVIEISEKSLPDKEAPFFADSLRALIFDLIEKYPGGTIYQAAPLPRFEIDGVVYIGDQPLKGLRYKKLNKSSRNNEIILIGLMGVISISGISFMLLDGFIKYDRAQVKYDIAVHDPLIRKIGGIDVDAISTMDAKKSFLDQHEKQSNSVGVAKNFLAAVSTIHGIRVVEAKFPLVKNQPKKEIDQKKDERKKSKVVNEKQSKDVAEVDWDVLLTISVKKNDQTMLDQAHEIVVKISEATGGSFRVAQKERREIGDKRIIRLEGFYAK